MSATGLDVFDKTLHTTNTWLTGICDNLGPDRQIVPLAQCCARSGIVYQSNSQPIWALNCRFSSAASSMTSGNRKINLRITVHRTSFSRR